MTLSKAAMLAATTILLLASVESHAANWVRIDGNGATTVFVDKQSLRRTGVKVKAWAKFEFATPREVKASHPKKTYRAAALLNIYNCSERTSITTQMAAYETPDMDNVVDTVSFPDLASQYSDEVPGSIGEAILEFACKEAAPANG